MTEEELHTTCSISMPRYMKAELDARAAKLRLTRTDYLRLLILADLDKGDAPLEVKLPVHQPIAAVEKKAPRKKHEAKKN
jgi:hypothetical protein